MVKYIRHFWTGIKRIVLISTILLLGFAFWLHGGVRSLQFAKPWIVSTMNSPDAPYVISIGDVTIDWSNMALLGKVRISDVTFAKRDGNVFAQLPEVYTTIDPIGFLPSRRLLHKVILHNPRIFAARNLKGEVELGFEGSPSRMPMSELTAFFVGDENATKPAKAPSLPFHDFLIDDATLTFTDETTDTKIVSTPFDLNIRRRHGTYEAFVAMPFTVDDHPVKLGASLTAQEDSAHKLTVQLSQMPSRLICLFDTCPEKVAADGMVNGTVVIIVAEDMGIHQFRAALATPKAVFTAPQWFAEPLKLTDSNVVVSGDWSKKQIALTQAKLNLEDTTIDATANLHKGEDGWYATGDAVTGRLNVDKIYKYWPLIMAPDSRTWITSKLKTGYAQKGTLKVNLTPADMAADSLSEKAIDAVADARDIGFEYLPGFPAVQKMSGIAHFTGTTVKVEGTTGSLMSGTTISHAVLWCPDLNNSKNPMEAEVTLSAPATDAAAMLALKHFPFDDSFGLDPKTIKGTIDATMKLKFDAFSGKPNSDPNEIHLEAVDYDINAKLKNVSQDNVYGGYNAHAINGELKANNKGIDFDGTLWVGDAGTNSVKLTQESGKAMDLAVKGIAGSDGQPAVTSNDFTMNYVGGTIPAITIRGKRLDASASYGNTENGLLANFPAMKLDIKLDELLLVAKSAFTDVVGTLNCSTVKCDAAQFTAKAGKDTIKAGIVSNAGQRQFQMTAGDAGAFLKGLDITDRMTRGAFDMRGSYDDKKNPPQFNGRLLITDFTLKNSEILGRILSVGSLTGLQNLLTGNGISFEKLSANITSRAGIITVDKGLANGNSLGITVGGTVDTTSTKLNLKGVVAPAYALNTIFSKIPIVGAILGGDQGLIAFNYSVKGTYEKPDVGVNPLSGLTPGFLRGIFGVFDQKEPKQGDTKGKSVKETVPEVDNPVSRVNKR